MLHKNKISATIILTDGVLVETNNGVDFKEEAINKILNDLAREIALRLTRNHKDIKTEYNKNESYTEIKQELFVFTSEQLREFVLNIKKQDLHHIPLVIM